MNACAIKRDKTGKIDRVFNVLSLPKSKEQLFINSIGAKPNPKVKNAYDVKYGDTTLSFSVLPNTRISVDLIETKDEERGKGKARKAFDAFLKQADLFDLTTEGVIAPRDRKTDENKLASFYQSLGYKFKVENGFASDFEIERFPKKVGMFSKGNKGDTSFTKTVLNYFERLINRNTTKPIISTDKEEMNAILREYGFVNLEHLNARPDFKVFPETIKSTKNIKVGKNRVAIYFSDDNVSRIKTLGQTVKIAEGIHKKVSDNLREQMGEDFKPHYVVISKYSDGTAVDVNIPKSVIDKIENDTEISNYLEELATEKDFAFLKEELDRGVDISTLSDLGYRFMKTPTGQIFGMFLPNVNGQPKVFINTDIATPETIVEEMAHLQYYLRDIAALAGDSKAQQLKEKEEELLEDIFNEWNTLKEKEVETTIETEEQQFKDAFSKDVRFGVGGYTYDKNTGKEVKKIYVSIRVPNDVNRKKDGTYEYKYSKEKINEIKSGTLKGVEGVSSSPYNIADWLGFRDAVVVMPYDEFVKLNDTEQLDYDNASYLIADGLKSFHRLFNEKEFTDISYKHVFSKIAERLSMEFNTEAKTSNNKAFSILADILNPSISSKGIKYITEQARINSVEDLANILVEYLNSEQINKDYSFYFLKGETNFQVDSELINALEKGIIGKAAVYRDESEFLLKDKTLNIPKGSQIFFNAHSSENKQAIDEAASSENLNENISVHYINSKDIEKYRNQKWKAQEKLYADKLQENKNNTDKKILSVIETLSNKILEEVENKAGRYIEDAFGNEYTDIEGYPVQGSIFETPEVAAIFNNIMYALSSKISAATTEVVKTKDLFPLAYRVQPTIQQMIEDLQSENRDTVATTFKDERERDILYYNIYEAIGRAIRNTDFGISGAEVKSKVGADLYRYFPANEIRFAVPETEGTTPEVRTMTVQGQELKVKSVDVDVANGFYSPLEKLLNVTKRDKQPVKQWIEKFAKGEETKWTGLTDWLNQQQGSVSKADIQKYLKENRIQIVEVVKGEAGFDNFQKKVEEAERKFGVRVSVDENPMDGSPSISIGGEKLDEMNEDEIQELEEEVTDFVMAEASDTENIPKFSQYQLEGEKENYKEVLVTLPSKAETDNDISNRLFGKNYSELKPFQKEEVSNEAGKSGATKFKSPHFDEPNILIHLRMNTRTDAQGNKVLFLEEVQSDWGQKGKKEGFEDDRNKLIDEKWNKIDWEKEGDWEGATLLGTGISVVKKNGKYQAFVGLNRVYRPIAEYETVNEAKEAIKGNFDFTNYLSAQGEKRGVVPNAPFVTDTNAWVKLGLKVALKEAIAQGADKIAWTTGEQQNERYDLSKQVEKVFYEKHNDGTYYITVKDKKDGQLRDAGMQNIPENKLADFVGKELAEKIINGEGRQGEGRMTRYKVFDGLDLKVGGKGMKGFYGNPTDGSIGIVGGVAELFESNSELSKIGTKEQYSAYLDTIFPDSKVKDIVYHRTKSDKFDRFNNKSESYVNNDTYTKDGIYFNNDINNGKEVYGKNVIISIVNIINPYLFKAERLFAKEGDNPYNLSLNTIKQEQLLGKEDGILFRPNEKNGQTIVFEPEQIHILGSKQDIQGFKEFVKQQKPTDGNIGIVGRVAEKLFGQKVGTVEIEGERKQYADYHPSAEEVGKGKKLSDNEKSMYLHTPFSGNFAYAIENGKAKRLIGDDINNERGDVYIVNVGKSKSTQHSIDITPEMKAQASEGLPLFNVQKFTTNDGTSVSFNNLNEEAKKTIETNYEQNFGFYNFDWNKESKRENFKEWHSSFREEAFSKNLRKVIQEVKEDIKQVKQKELVKEKLEKFEDLLISTLGNSIAAKVLSKFEEMVLLNPEATIQSIEKGFEEAKNKFTEDGSLDMSKLEAGTILFSENKIISLAAFEDFVEKNTDYKGAFDTWKKLSDEYSELLVKNTYAFRVVSIEELENLYSSLNSVLPLLQAAAQAQTQSAEQALFEKTGIDLRSEVYRKQSGESKEKYRNRLMDEIRAKMIADLSIKNLEAVKPKSKLAERIKAWLLEMNEWFRSLVGLQDTPIEEIKKMSLQEFMEASSKSLFKGEFFKEIEEFEEIAKIFRESKANGSFMKAPNGYETNLTTYQWLLVRTNRFKGWFGDWENDPENASKVVDANGEPRVVYHGSGDEIIEFKEGFGGTTTGNNDFDVFYFSSKQAVSEDYGEQSLIRKYEGMSKDDLMQLYELTEEEADKIKEDLFIYAEENAKIYPTFLNIRKIFTDTTQSYKGLDLSRAQRLVNYTKNGVDENYEFLHDEEYNYSQHDIDMYKDEIEERARENYILKEGEEVSEEQFNSTIAEIMDENAVEYEDSGSYNGIIIFNTIDNIGDKSYVYQDEYIVFDSNDIKLADGSNRNFSPYTNDIRYNTKESTLFNSITTTPHVNSLEEAKDIYFNVFSEKFKNKFGDWENYQTNSTFLNEDGEPQLFYLAGNGEVFTDFSEALKATSDGYIKMGFISTEDILVTENEDLYLASLSDFSKYGNKMKLENMESFIEVNEISGDSNPSTVGGFINSMIRQGLVKGMKEGIIEASGKTDFAQAANADIIHTEAVFRFGNKAVTKVGSKVEISPVKADELVIKNPEGKTITYSKKALMKRLENGEIQEVRDIVGNVGEFLYNNKRQQVESFYEDKVEEVTPKEETTLRNNLLSLLKSLGISVTSITEYAKAYKLRHGVDLSVDAIADLANNVVAFAEGKMTTANITEETAHIIVEAHPNQDEINAILPEVENTPEWEQYSAEYFVKYADMYSGEELQNAVRREVLGKILAASIINNFEAPTSLISKLAKIFSDFLNSISSYFTDSHKSKLNNLIDKLTDISYRKNAAEYLNKDLLAESQIVLYANSSNAKVNNVGTQHEKLKARLEKQVQELEARQTTLARLKTADASKIKFAIRNVKKLIEENDLKAAAKIALATHDAQLSNMKRQLEYYKKQARTNGEKPFFNIGDQSTYNYLKDVALPTMIELRGLFKGMDDVESADLVKKLGHEIARINDLEGDKVAQMSDDIQRILDEVVSGISITEEDKQTIKDSIEEEQRDVSGFQRLFGGLAHSSNIFLNLLGKLINNVYYNTKMNTLSVINPILRKATEKGWNIGKFKEVIKRSEDGKNSGYLLSDIDMGKFMAEEKKFMDDWYEKYLTDEQKADIKTKGGKPNRDILNEDQLKDFIEAQLAWKIENEELFFNDEYYLQREADYKAAGISSENRAFISELSRRTAEIKQKYRKSDGTIDKSKMSKEDLDSLAIIKQERDSRKNSYDMLGEPKTGIELALAEELQALDKIKAARATKRDIKKEFFDTLYEIERTQGREVAVAFLLANGGITFSDKYWETITSGKTVEVNGVEVSTLQVKINQAYDKLIKLGDTEAQRRIALSFKAYQKAITARKQILKQYSRANNPAELNTALMPDIVKEKILELDELIQTNMQVINAKFRELEIKGEPVNSYEFTTNEAYNEDLAEDGRKELDFLSDNLTSDNQNRVKLFSTQIENLMSFGTKKMSKSFRAFLANEYGVGIDNYAAIEELIAQNTPDAILTAYARSKVASYYKRFAPVGYEELMQKLKTGSESVSSIVKGIRNEDNSFFNISSIFEWANIETSDDIFRNINYKANSAHGFRQPKISKYRDKEFFSRFNPTYDDETGIYTPKTNLDQWDMIETFKGVMQKSLEKYGEDGRSLYKLPMKSKTDIEKVLDLRKKAGMVEAVRDSIFNRKDEKDYGEQIDGVETQNLGVNLIPKYYLTDLDNFDNIAEDLLSAYTAMLREANLYDERVNMIGDVLLMKQKLLSKQFEKGKAADTTNTVKMFDNFVGAYFYGQKQTQKKEIELLGRKVDVSKIASSFDRWVRMTNVGFSLPIALSSALVSNTNLRIERLIGEHISNSSAKWASKEMMKLLPSYASNYGKIGREDKLYLLGEAFGFHNETDRAKNSGYSKGLRAISDTPFAFMNIAATPHNTKVLLAILDDHRLIGDKVFTFNEFKKRAENVRLTKGQLEEAWSQHKQNSVYNLIEFKDGNVNLNAATIAIIGEEYARKQFQRINTKVQDTNGNIDALIPDTDRSVATRHFLLNFTTAHRGWLTLALQRRFKKGNFNFSQGVFEKGHYTSLFQFIGDVTKMARTMGMKAAVEEMSKYSLLDNLSEEQLMSKFNISRQEATELKMDRNNLKRVTIDFAVFMLLTIMSMFIAAADDDEENRDNWAIHFMSYMFFRTTKEMGSSQIPFGAIDILDTVKSPFVALSSIDKILGSFSLDRMEHGYYKGDTKLYRGLISQTWFRHLEVLNTDALKKKSDHYRFQNSVLFMAQKESKEDKKNDKENASVIDAIWGRIQD